MCTVIVNVFKSLDSALFGIRHLPVVFVGDHQSAVVHSPDRGRNTSARVRSLILRMLKSLENSLIIAGFLEGPH
jgi:hypothetical protein